jgi:hypothetical protein
MPHAPVYGLVIQEHFNDLVVATYGRGFYILDDLTPLQKLTPAITASAAHLFAPHSTYRFRDVAGNVGPSDDQNYTLPSRRRLLAYLRQRDVEKAPAITVLDAAGRRCAPARQRPSTGSRLLGLQNEPTRSPRMHTKPMFNPEF